MAGVPMGPHYVTDALRYSQWALEMAMVPPLRAVFLVATASLVASGLKQRPLHNHLWKRRHWFLVSHFLFFIAAIVVGLLGAIDPASTYHPHQAATFWIYAVALGSLVSCIWWIWQMKGFRWFAVSLMTLLEVITLSAILVAGMSVSGDWP